MKKFIIFLFMISFFFLLNCSEDINEPGRGKIKGTWRKVATTGDVPSERFAHPMIYDGNAHRIIIHGGFYPGTIFSDTYSLDLTTLTWEKLSDGPLQRAYHTTVLDNVMNRLIVFGGGDSLLVPTNETWTFDLATKQWSEIITTGSIPAKRNGNAAFLDQAGNRLIIYGGASSSGAYNETFALDLNSLVWSELEVTGDVPASRTHMGFASTANDSTVIIFGGEDNYGQFFEDAYTFNVKTNVWTQLITFSDEPYGRSGCAFQYIPSFNGFIIFGGFSSIGSLNDTHLFNIENRSWDEVETGGDIPTRRIPMAGAFNPVNEKFLIFTGWNGYVSSEAEFYNELYELTIDFNDQ